MNVPRRQGRAQLGGGDREPDRPQAERLEPRDAAARRRHHGAGHRRAQRQPAGVGRSVVLTATGRQVFNVGPRRRPQPLARRGRRRAGRTSSRGSEPAGRRSGYWAYPSATVLVEDGVNVRWIRDGQLKNVADAAKVAPMQPWALALYRNRQRRFLQDDPTYSTASRRAARGRSSSPYGVQFVEDRERQRIFVLIGGGNAQLPHPVPRRPRARRARSAGTTTTRSTTAERWQNGRATRWWWTPRDSTRTSGSPTGAAAYRPAAADRALHPDRLRHAEIRGHGDDRPPTPGSGRPPGRCDGLAARSCRCTSVRTTGHRTFDSCINMQSRGSRGLSAAGARRRMI